MSSKTLSVLPTNQTLQTASQLQKSQVFSYEKQPVQIDAKRYNSFCSLVLHTLVISFSSFYFGYTIAYMAAVDFDTIMSIYKIPIKKQIILGVLVACIPIGGGVGALLSGYFVKKFSRRKNLLLVNCLAIIFGSLIYIPAVQMLIIARLGQGICAGFYSSLAPLIMKELSPTQVSGTLTSFNQIFIAFGVFFSFAYALTLQLVFNDPLSGKTWWMVFGLPLISILIQSILLIFFYPYQTPKYLYSIGDDHRGKRLVERIYKPEYVQEVIKEIRMNLGQQVVDTNSQDKSETYTLSVNEANLQPHQRQTPRNAIIVAIHLAALQQFCGVNVIIAYAGDIVGGTDSTLKLVVSILINMEQVMAAIFTSYLLTVIGRKPLLQVGSIMTFVSCAIIAIGFFLQPIQPGTSLVLKVFGLVLFMASFGFTLGPVVWVYLSQIVQPNVLPVATTVNWASAAVILMLFPVIKQTLPNQNPGFLFLFFALWGTLSYFFNKKFVIQTQNKGQKQIFEQYQSGRQIKQY